MTDSVTVRPGAPRPLDASSRRGQARFDRVQFWARVGVVYLLTSGALVVESAGPARFSVAVFLAVVVGPAHLVVRRVVGVPNPTGWLDLLAVASGVVVAIIEPTLWPAALLFQMLTLGGAVAFLRPVWTAWLGGGSVATMALLGYLSDVSVAPQMTVVAVIFLPVLIGGSNRKLASQRRAGMRIDAAVESLPMLVWEGERTSGRIRAITGRTEAILGRSFRDVVERGIAADVHFADRDEYLSRFGAADLAQTDHVYRYERPDGSLVWLRDRVVLADESGGGDVVRGVTVDVTSQLANEVGLRRQEQIVERMAAVTVVVERRGDELIVAQVTDPIDWGLTVADVGLPFAAVLPELADRAELGELLQAGGGDDVATLGPWPVCDTAGTERTVEVEVFDLPGDATAVLVTDVTEREQVLSLIRHRATHDDLTGLANRTTLMEAANKAIATGTHVVLLLIDLNEFKALNDTLGHLSGDAYLKQLAERLAEVGANTALVARLGGDEFAMLLVDPPDARISHMIDQVAAACRTPVNLHGAAIAGSASVGVARAPDHAADAETLLRCADLAMYDAKRKHGGVRFYHRSLDRSAEQLHLLGQIGDAFDAGQFVMWFQPKYRFGDGALVGFEALVRWDHPERGMLAPADFLDMVTVAGCADELADTAIRGAAAALAQLPEHLTVAVNLTVTDLRNPDLPARCETILSAAGVEMSRLVVEITESQVLDASSVARDVISELAASGAVLAVDDFGTGFSSLSHLRTLPLGELKIDRRFVSEMLHNPQDLVIVRTMIELGHHLGLTVTAEGIEDQPTADRLRALGCDAAQGYLFGRPGPLDLGDATPRSRDSARAGVDVELAERNDESEDGPVDIIQRHST